jgi:hypothetical protein
VVRLGGPRPGTGGTPPGRRGGGSGREVTPFSRPPQVQKRTTECRPITQRQIRGRLFEGQPGPIFPVGSHARKHRFEIVVPAFHRRKDQPRNRLRGRRGRRHDDLSRPNAVAVKVEHIQSLFQEVHPRVGQSDRRGSTVITLWSSVSPLLNVVLTLRIRSGTVHPPQLLRSSHRDPRTSSFTVWGR